MAPELESERSDDEERRRRREKRRRLRMKRLSENRQTQEEPVTSPERTAKKKNSTIRRIGERAWRAVFPKTEKPAEQQEIPLSRRERLAQFGRKVAFLITGVRRDVEVAVANKPLEQRQEEVAPLDTASERLQRATQRIEAPSFTRASSTENLQESLGSSVTAPTRHEHEVENDSSSRAQDPTKAVHPEAPDYEYASAISQETPPLSTETVRSVPVVMEIARLKYEQQRRKQAEQLANTMGVVATVATTVALWKTIQSHDRKKAIQGLEKELDSSKNREKQTLQRGEKQLRELHTQQPDLRNDIQRKAYVREVAAFGNTTAEMIERQTVNRSPGRPPEQKPLFEIKEQATVQTSENKKKFLETLAPNTIERRSNIRPPEQAIDEKVMLKASDKKLEKPRPISQKETPEIETSSQTVEGIEAIDTIDGVLTEQGYSRQIENRDRDALHGGSGSFSLSQADDNQSSSNTAKKESQAIHQQKAHSYRQKTTARRHGAIALALLSIAVAVMTLL